MNLSHLWQPEHNCGGYIKFSEYGGINEGITMFIFNTHFPQLFIC